MKKIKIGMALIIFILLVLATFCGAKRLNNYRKYSELKKINHEYIALKEEIKNYEIAIEEYKLANGEKLDNEKKIQELNNKITALNKEIDNYNKNITRLNKELGTK